MTRLSLAHYRREKASLPTVWHGNFASMINDDLERVAIVGSSQTQLRSAWGAMQHVDLLSATVSDLLLGSGFRIEDIDVVIDCGSDVLDGRSISNCGFLGAMGAHHKEESRVEEDGIFGAIYGANKVSCGSADVALVIAYSKPSESSVSAYYSTMSEPFYQRPLGLDHVSAAGLMANQYLIHSGATEEDLITIAFESWAKANRNKDVQMASAPTRDDIARAARIADPLTAPQLSRPVDGAVAILIAKESVARKLSDRPVWITGMGSAIDSHYLTERVPGKMRAAETATKFALKGAGISDINQFKLAEISATSSANEAMVVEALGFAEFGKAINCYNENSQVSINPSGGAIPADPIMATGLVRLHESYKQLSGGYGEIKFDKAIAHGAGGLGMQNHCVITLEA
jgi:acetyl-CoA C-acetyltransferase